MRTTVKGQHRRFTTRKQSSSWATSESYYVYDTQTRGRVTLNAFSSRGSAEASAAKLNEQDADYQAKLADPQWIRERDAKLAAMGLAVDENDNLVPLPAAQAECA